MARLYFGETPEKREVALKELKSLIMSKYPKMLENVPEDDPDQFLVKMLRAGSFLPDKTVILLDNYTQMLRSKYFERVFEEDSRWNLAGPSFKTNTTRVCKGR